MSIILCQCERLARGLPLVQERDRGLPLVQERDRDGRTKKITIPYLLPFAFFFPSALCLFPFSSLLPKQLDRVE